MLMFVCLYFGCCFCFFFFFFSFFSLYGLFVAHTVQFKVTSSNIIVFSKICIFKCIYTMLNLRSVY